MMKKKRKILNVKRKILNARIRKTANDTARAGDKKVKKGIE